MSNAFNYYPGILYNRYFLLVLATRSFHSRYQHFYARSLPVPVLLALVSVDVSVRLGDVFVVHLGDVSVVHLVSVFACLVNVLVARLVSVFVVHLASVSDVHLVSVVHLCNVPFPIAIPLIAVWIVSHGPAQFV